MRSCFSLQMAWSCCRILAVYIVILLLGAYHKLPVASFSEDTFNAIEFAGLYGPSGGLLALLPGSVAELFSALSPTHLASFFTTWLMGLNITAKCGICCLQNLKKLTKPHASLLAVRGARCKKLIFTLERMSHHASDHLTPKHFTDVIDS